MSHSDNFIYRAVVVVILFMAILMLIIHVGLEYLIHNRSLKEQYAFHNPVQKRFPE